MEIVFYKIFMKGHGGVIFLEQNSQLEINYSNNFRNNYVITGGIK